MARLSSPDLGQMTAEAPGSAKTLAYDGAHLQAIIRRGTSPFVLVTFNGRGFRADGASIWGDPLVRKLDLNAVGFVTKRPNWFPGGDLSAAVDAVRPFVEGFEERIGYGYSQGGYAAIKASRPLGLSTTLSLSPQWSIDPRDIVDPRYNGFFDARANAGMALTAADAPQRLFILVDPRFPDDANQLASITQAIATAQIVSLPSTEHETIRILQGSAQFSAMIDAVRAGTSLAAALAPFRRANTLRREVMIKRALHRRNGARAHALLAGLPLEGKDKTKMLIRFARHGAGERVIEEAQRHARGRPADAVARATLALVLGSAGKKRRAEKVAERAETMGGGKRVTGLIREARSGAVALEEKPEDR